MRWPDVVVSAQMKRVARDVTLDIRKKVFVGRDAESRRPALPFDFKYSAGVDLGKGANRSVIRFDVAIASNANPSASSGQGDADSQKYNRDLLHGKYDSPVRMQQRLALDSRKFGERNCSAIRTESPSGEPAAGASICADGSSASPYSTIFISAVSAKMSST